MSRLASLSRMAVVRPMEFLHLRARAVPAAPPGRAAPDGDAHDAHDAHDGGGRAGAEAERLERISVYARAGYFHMGYTFEMFPLVGDLPPE